MTRMEAARQNGALSHGPATDEGRARSAQNARKHGLTSREVVIPGEDAAEFDALLDSIRDAYQPATPQEDDLVCEIAASRWRLRRTALMEKAVIQTEMNRVANDKDNSVTDPELASALAWAAIADSSALKQIHRHETRLRRSYEKASNELRLLQQVRELGEAAKLAAAEQDREPRPQPVPAASAPGFPPVQNEPVVRPNASPHLRAA